MSPFLRIGLSNFDCGTCQSCQGEAVNPYCAVLVKEYVESGKIIGVRVGEEEEGVGTRLDKPVGDKTFLILPGHLMELTFTV